MTRFFAPVLLSLMASVTTAEEVATIYPFDGSFDDATFGVESAIVGRGLVIDFVSHTGDMLARTAADVGSDVVLFEEAQIFNFCSASISRKVMEADPMNLAHCPYAIFVYERDDAVAIGFRNQPLGVMQEVQALLDDIVKEAVGE